MKFISSTLKAILVAATCLCVPLTKSVTLTPDLNGDAQYSLNTKTGVNSYIQGGTRLNVGLTVSPKNGNTYSIGLFEIPIDILRVTGIIQATLVVNSFGFTTGYLVGRAGLTWIDLKNISPTGNVVADNIGNYIAKGGIPAPQFSLWTSDQVNNGAGLVSFDVTAQLLIDLEADRNYSTFALIGTRDTIGGIYALNSASPPMLDVEIINTLPPIYPPPDITPAIPEPSTWVLMIGGLIIIIGISKRRSIVQW